MPSNNGRKSEHERCMEDLNHSLEPDSDLTRLVQQFDTQLELLRRNTMADILKLGATLSTTLSTTVSSQLEKLESQLTTSLTTLQKDTYKMINVLTASIDDTKIETTLALDHLARRNDLIVWGVPVTRKENLPNYFAVWCRSLGYDGSRIPIAHLQRIPPRSTDSPSSMIRVQFAFPDQRNEFYCRYIRTHSLTLAELGFASQQRIYVNENLGPLARKLRFVAVQLKREGKIHSVYSMNGIIHVKLNADERGVAVLRESHLRMLVKKIPIHNR